MSRSFTAKSDISQFLVASAVTASFPKKECVRSVRPIVDSGKRFNHGSVIRCCATLAVSTFVNFAGSTFYADVANFRVERPVFFLSASSCRGERWSLLLNSFPSVLETGHEIPNPKGRRLPPFLL